MFSAARVVWIRRGLALTLVAGLVVGLPPVAAVAAPVDPSDVSVPVQSLASKVSSLPEMPSFSPSKVVWPSAASAVIDLPVVNGVRAAAPPVVVGGLPIRVSPVASGDDLSGRGVAGLVAPAPASVRVEVLDQPTARRAGVPVAVRLSRADGGSGPAKVNVELDYSGFRHAYGGAFASRLRLVLLPECALAPVPDVAALRGECVGVPLATGNDFRAGLLSAEVDFATVLPGLSSRSLSPKEAALRGVEADTSTTSSSGPMVMAVSSSGDATGVGTFAKTDLKESHSWNAGGNSGNFTFNYPVGVPPVPGDLAPTVSLDYSSQAVDGQTAGENVQSGLVGEGWSLAGGGFIESTFRPCSQDQDHTPYWSNTTDTCWRHENFQLSWSGSSGELVPAGVPNVWKVASDEGAKVEYVTWSDTGLPYWKVTTSDGTQWVFGRQRLPGWSSGARETQSVLGQRVWANHSGEPCLNTGSFYNSHCFRPYRWYLDHVVDVHGNSMSYWYERFTNLHGSNGNGWNEKTYDRDAVLARIEYGTRVGSEVTATAPAMVEFDNADRCLTDCWNGSEPNTPMWPDTPWDLACGGPPCTSVNYYGDEEPVTGPTYWTTKRLAKVTTKVWTGTGTNYKKVDEWSLGHSFPGGTDVPVLWLDSVTRTGYDAAGNGSTLPALTTHGRKDRNRADYDPNAGMADPQKYRIDYLDTETGGRIEVSYLPANESACTWWSGKAESEWPNYDHNASRCFQQWVTNRSGESGWSWWHKFVVDKVTQKDMVGGSPDVVTSYEYLMDGAGSPSGHPLVLWGYTTGVWATIKKAKSSWKGYPTVITRTGPTGGVQSTTRQLFYRGLDRDTLLYAGGEFARRATITDSLGTTVDDHMALAGKVREQIVYNGSDEISKTVQHWDAWSTAGGSLPSWQTPPERYAYMTRQTSAKQLTKIADGSWRTTETVSTFDTTYGTVKQVDDKGDVATSADDVCAKYSYARNTNALRVIASSGGGGPSLTPPDFDWSAYDLIATPGDFNGDGRPDLLARNSLDSHLYLFTGLSNGYFSSNPIQVGVFWNDVDALFSPGDFSGDGKPDVIYRRASDQNLYMVKGNGAGGWIDGQSIAVGWGWHTSDRIFSPGDVTGDGKPDVFYRRASDGRLFFIRGNGTGGWIDGASIAVDSADWRDRDVIFGKGDATGDGKTDLFARVAATGELKRYAGNADGTFAAPVTVGTGWNRYRHALTAGDIRGGDGKADLIYIYGGARLTSTVSRVETYGVACASTPAELLADVRTYYDGNTTYTAVPMKGLPTKTDQAKSYNGWTASYITTSETGYDQWGRPVTLKDALGRQTAASYTHNTAGLLESVTVSNPLGHLVTTTVEPLHGLPVTVADPNGKVTTGAYDRLGRLVKVWQPGHSTSGTPDVELVYTMSKSSPSHTATKVLGPNGNQITSYEIFDGFLRPRQTQTITEAGRRMITDTRYDKRGLAERASVFYNSASAPTSTLETFDDINVARQTHYTYDGAGRQVKAELLSNNAPMWATTTVYQGDRTGVIPPAGGTVTQELFDARGRVTEKRQYQSPSGFTGSFDKTLYTYDDANRLTKVTDPAENQWTYTYDLLGRKVKTIDPDAGTSTSTYDNAGQVLSTVDGRGQALFYEYDNLGRRTRTRDGSATGPTLAQWVYDTYAKGQLAESIHHVGADQYKTRVTSWDDGYRPLHAEVVIPNATANGALAATYAYDYTYKTNGAPATVKLPGVGGLPAETLTYGYSDTGFAQTLAGAWAGGGQTYLADIDYYYDGLVSAQFLGAPGKQVKQVNQFEAATRRLTLGRVDLETATQGSFATKYENVNAYDAAGNVTSVAGTTDGVADQEECFQYDHLRRLTQAWTQTSGSCTTPQRGGADPYWRQWTFDAVGNRLTQVDKDPVAGDTTWTYQVGAVGGVKPHQLKKVDATGPIAGTPTRSFGYDAAGNTTSATTPTGAGQTLTWDKEGHLQSVVEGGDTTSYVYDADGNRLLARTPIKTTLYLPVGTELDLPSGGGSVLGTRHYNGVAVRDATGLKWVCSNHQGSSLMQIDSLTLESVRRRMLPYGEDRGTQPTQWMGTKGYVGGTKDTTGYTHLGAREYDPTLGRFISVDPIMALEDVQSWHGYAYSGNSPVTFADPSGLVRPGPGVEPGDSGPPASHKPGCHQNNKSPSCDGGYGGSGAGGGNGHTPGYMTTYAGVAILANNNTGYTCIWAICAKVGPARAPNDIPAPLLEAFIGKLNELALSGNYDLSTTAGQFRLVHAACAETGACGGAFEYHVREGAQMAMLAEQKPTAWSHFIDSHPGLIEGAQAAGGAMVAISLKTLRSRTAGSGAYTQKIDNISSHLTQRDLDAARRELNGEVVARKSSGTPWDHVAEVRDAQRGLLNIINRINRDLANPNLSPSARASLQGDLSRASRMLDYSEGFVPRP